MRPYAKLLLPLVLLNCRVCRGLAQNGSSQNVGRCWLSAERRERRQGWTINFELFCNLWSAVVFLSFYYRRTLKRKKAKMLLFTVVDVHYRLNSVSQSTAASHLAVFFYFSALVVLNDYALYKSTHSLTRSAYEANGAGCIGWSRV